MKKKPRTSMQSIPPAAITSIARGRVGRRVAGVVAALLVLGAGARCWMEPYRVHTLSMAPMLSDGDLLLVDRFARSERRLERGDVVVLRHPQDASAELVLRVVGLPGDRVQVREDGSVENGGRSLPRCELGPWPMAGRDPGLPTLRGFVEWQGPRKYLVLHAYEAPVIEGEPGSCVREACLVPPGRFFALGDYRDEARDGRHLGFIDFEALRGKVVRVLAHTQRIDGGEVTSTEAQERDPRVPGPLREMLATCTARAR